jgi:ABC-type uncharacterized transport system involved in gliding motility auxiliary subunit
LPPTAYGFQVGRDLVFDRRNVLGPLPGALGPGSRGLALVNFPGFVAVKPAGTSTGADGGDRSSILTGIDALVFPFASSLALTAPAWVLARSSAESWTETGAFSLAGGEAAPSPSASTVRRSVALAGAYQGPPRPSAPAPATGAAGAGGARVLRLVVVADSDFVSDRYMELLRTFPIYAGGPELLLNAVGWAMADDALTALRARVLRGRPLDVGGDDNGATAALIQWANVAGLPLVVCAAGLLRWRWRTATRRRQRLPGAGSAPS